jgi:hypothetical protein
VQLEVACGKANLWRRGITKLATVKSFLVQWLEPIPNTIVSIQGMLQVKARVHSELQQRG